MPNIPFKYYRFTKNDNLRIFTNKSRSKLPYLTCQLPVSIIMVSGSILLFYWLDYVQETIDISFILSDLSKQINAIYSLLVITFSNLLTILLYLLCVSIAFLMLIGGLIRVYKVTKAYMFHRRRSYRSSKRFY